MADHPKPESAANGAESAVREAIATITAKTGVRDARGRFTSDTTARITTGQRSEAFWEALAPARAAIVDETLHGLGLTADEASPVRLRLLGAYAGVSLFRESMEIRLMESGGPITGKGRMRALYRAYVAALDRETKLAQMIGLDRKARTVQTAQELLS